MIRLLHPDGRAEKLRWTDKHPASHYGLGVVLRGHGGRILDGVNFKLLAVAGAKIICSDDRERRRVAGALAWPALGFPETFLEVRP